VALDGIYNFFSSIWPVLTISLLVTVTLIVSVLVPAHCWRYGNYHFFTIIQLPFELLWL